ncbi:hypothetical protein ACQPYA_04330 [Micromonospora sp. CA-263727]|uniref:hypothetical protein n=1 Tax=Micromonospora sp. CA-263727 TaxID=3239967 RepID=UPI003D8B973E
MDSTTDHQIAQAVTRMGPHLLRAVSASPRSAKVVQATFSLPGVGGRGGGLNPSVVGTLLATWAEQIALVGADAHDVPDAHAQRLVDAARAGFDVLEPLVVATVRALDGAAQRALLITLAEHLTGDVLPLLGGLHAVQRVNGWLYDSPSPPPTARERVQATVVSTLVAAHAAGNHPLAEHVLTTTATRPDGREVLASMFGWLVRVAVIVLDTAHGHRPPTDPSDPRLPDPTVDPALPDPPDTAYDAARRAITAVTADQPAAVLGNARAIAALSTPSLAAVVRYAAVTVARSVHAAGWHTDREASEFLDPDTGQP